MNEQKIIRFYLEYKKFFNIYISNIRVHINELISKHNITKDEIKFILINYDTTFDISHILQSIYYSLIEEIDETYVDAALVALSGAMQLQNITNIEHKIIRIKEIIDEN